MCPETDNQLREGVAGRGYVHRAHSAGSPGRTRERCVTFRERNNLTTDNPTPYELLPVIPGSYVIRDPGGTEWTSQTLPPMTEPAPMTVSPPRIVAPE